MLSAPINRVLVVDDDAALREVLVMGLQALGGLEAEAVGSGREALAVAAREPRPDLILLDVMMPELDGPATLARLREQPETAHIPVAFCTARALGAERRWLEEHGVIGVVTKPCRLSELVAWIEGLSA